MAASLVRRVVVFDVGGVLCHEDGRAEAVAAAAGVSCTTMDRAYWELRDAYDLGDSHVQYWTGVLDRVGVQPTPTLVRELDRIDCASWSSLDEQAGVILAGLRDQRTPTVVLSNAPHNLARTLRLAPWFDLIAYSYFSCEMGRAKPDPEVFRWVTEDMAIDPTDVIFFDDRGANVAAARDAGWRAHIYESAERASLVLSEHAML
ncbi:HAD-IA family hydrolase [Microbacterium sp. NPDC058389]|uniref:HAD-IA family hydrolase n=1 Tax=Microbacterium sp. NPDC058389 TaxID=3346475 RepID=UPI00364B65CA